MYDRKKITLFVLLIATVILGGVSLFLATQINQNQSPDDSEASGGVCTSITNDSLSQATCGVGITQMGCTALVLQDNCCNFDDATSSCRAISNAPSYCSKVNCSTFAANESSCTGKQTIGGICSWQTTVTTCSFGGTDWQVGATRCVSYDQMKCSGTGSWAFSGCCNGGVQNEDGNCSAPPTTPPTTGTASCSEAGEIISHGNTACINGTNYTCNNGTATPGSSCTTEPPVTPPGGSTGSTCTPTLPVKAKLTGPGNGAVLNSTTATLTWDRNGSWGVGCPEQRNQFRIRLAVVDAASSCPTDTSNTGPYSRVGAIEGGPTGSFNLTVEDGKKYCWVIRKHNGSKAIDSGVRSFTVDIEEEVVDPGTDEDLTPGGEEVIDEEVVVPSPNVAAVAGDNTSLPETAILSDELDPIILGMILVIIGLTLYKFDFGRKRELE